MESWNSYTFISAETRNCRTSCTSTKRRDISRIVAIWIEWKVVVRFHGMLSLSAESPKHLDRREISNMNKDLVTHSKDHFLFDALVGHLPKLRDLKEIITRNVVGYALFAERHMGRRSSDHWYWKIGKGGCVKFFPRRLNAKEVLITQRDELSISYSRWFSKIIKKKLRIQRTHSETGHNQSGERSTKTSRFRRDVVW